ncbi:stress protein [Tepiditoga spiralis]|uniref:Stress protein n=1 Tax=Tepiditoga spiralis TaxID=2108365 RepID=A0A7G1G1X0_9BACT|nr:TerD family protein [Tepiditoga spiralis]BBE30280.1 stress protein [Tepiditoga spiralis]
MSINLTKGQKINLSKDYAGLSKIMVGLGWDPVEQSAKGFFKSLFKENQDIDCDASVLMLKNDKLQSNSDLVYFGNLNDKANSVIHQGDNLTGEGEGDDEQIFVDLSRVPSDISRLVFVVNIYDCVRRKQHFGMIKNAFIRLVDIEGKKELLKYNLSDDYSNKTSLVVAELYRHNNEWKFGAIGEGNTDSGLKELIKRYK